MFETPSVWLLSPPAAATPISRPSTAGLALRAKAAKLALTAVMRKLVVLANTLIREDRHWTPEYA